MPRNRYEIVEDVPASSGKTYLLKHLEGKRLTARQAAIAKCCDCMGYYVDGRDDCGITDCSLYPFMPYGKNKGKKTTNRTMSPERVQNMITAKREKSISRS